MKIAFLGTGSMSGAIVRGAIAAGADISQITVSTRTRHSSVALRDELGVSAFALETDPQANIKAIADAELIILGVKPYQILDLISEVEPHVSKGATLVSIAGGITIDSMKLKAPQHAIIRTMPNTPSQVGLGVTGLTASAGTSELAIAQTRNLFESVGEVIECSELQLDQLSTISGSGPAYVFYFIEQFEALALEYGFTPEQSAIMVRNTFRGASEMLASSGSQPAILRAAVTSPGGTTEQAVAEFEASDLLAVFRRASQSAMQRAQQIARGEG